MKKYDSNDMTVGMLIGLGIMVLTILGMETLW